MIEETVMRGRARLWCRGEKKIADIYYLNNATWDVICEYCGKIGEGSYSNNHCLVSLANVSDES